MTKQEFEQRLGSKVTDTDFALINEVYTWHPAISNVDGKEEIVFLWRMGRVVLRDMQETAARARAVDAAIAAHKGEIAKLEECLRHMSEGLSQDERLAAYLDKQAS